MSVRPSALFETAFLTTSNSTLYTCPANTRTIIDKMTLASAVVGTETANVFLVPSGGTPGDANGQIRDKPIAGGGSYLCPEVVGHVLNPGDMIVARASAATSISARVSGREVI